MAAGNTRRFVMRAFSKLNLFKRGRQQPEIQSDAISATPGENDSNKYENPKTQGDQSKSKYKGIKELAQRVSEAFKENKNLDELPFLPYSSLKEFANEENVRSAIAEANLENASDLIKFVLDGSERLFLILVLMSDGERKGLSLLNDFYQAKTSDAALPFGFKSSGATDSWFVVSCEPSEGEVLFSVTQWARNETELFDHYQWRLLAPVFGEDFHYHFHARRIFPYRRMKSVSSGHFGDVSRVEILTAHIPAIKAVRTSDTVHEQY